ncbi:MAG TPA: prohibitin family protein [Anaeromyxobacteraceae bacterium]|nr:prohibitin family protein [Anaeromyxobacteraceae bacterium]
MPSIPQQPRDLGFVARIVLGVVVLVALVTFGLGSWYTVNAGERGVQTRFGSIVKVTGPGLHFKAPWIDDVTKINVQTTWVEWRNEGPGKDHRMEGYSHDQQPVLMSVKIPYHAKPDEASIREIYAQYHDTKGFAEAIIIPRAAEAVKTTFGQFTAISVIQDRQDYNNKAQAAVLASVGNGPVILDGVNIYDIKFSDVYEKAVEARMQAEVAVQQMKQNLEQKKLEADMVVVKATADATAVKLAGDAQAAAIRARSDALRDSPRLVELTAAEKWDGHLPQTMIPGGALPFIHLGQGHGGEEAAGTAHK